jgi:hypothetical protein
MGRILQSEVSRFAPQNPERPGVVAQASCLLGGSRQSVASPNRQDACATAGFTGSDSSEAKVRAVNP